jgi:dCMP deaminase
MNTEKLVTFLQNKIIKEKTRINWNEYFMSIAILASVRSSCNRLNVGCVLVKNNRILAMGYNGFLPGAKHISYVRNNHEQATVHAEQNAISDAANRGVSINKSTAYITHYPCINCFKLLISSGINKIYYLEDYKNDVLINQICEDSNLNIIIQKLEIK